MRFRVIENVGEMLFHCMTWYEPKLSSYCPMDDPITKLKIADNIDFLCSELHWCSGGISTHKRGPDLLTKESLRIVVLVCRRV